MHEDLRSRIVAGARSRFKRYGYAKTSMQEIAKDCGMSAANLYRYYDGKLGIGVAVAAELQAELLAACDQAVTREAGQPTRRLVAFFETVIDVTRRQMKRTPLLFELRLAVAREKPEQRQGFLREIETRIVSILTPNPPQPAPLAPDPAAMGRLVFLASAPFVLPWMMLNTPFGDPRPHVAPLVHCLISGLRAESLPQPSPSGIV